MNRYIKEEFYNDPALRLRLFGEAHRERARAISAGLTWLRGAISNGLERLKPGRPARWIERLG